MKNEMNEQNKFREAWRAARFTEDDASFADCAAYLEDLLSEAAALPDPPEDVPAYNRPDRVGTERRDDEPLRDESVHFAYPYQTAPRVVGTAAPAAEEAAK